MHEIQFHFHGRLLHTAGPRGLETAGLIKNRRRPRGKISPLPIEFGLVLLRQYVRIVVTIFIAELAPDLLPTLWPFEALGTIDA